MTEGHCFVSEADYLAGTVVSVHLDEGLEGNYITSAALELGRIQHEEVKYRSGDVDEATCHWLHISDPWIIGV